MGIIGCEWGGGCEWEVVVGVAGAVLRLEERLLPAQWQVLEDGGKDMARSFGLGEPVLHPTTKRNICFLINKNKI